MSERPERGGLEPNDSKPPLSFILCLLRLFLLHLLLRAFLPCIFVLYPPLFARLVAASYPGPQRLSASACYLMPITHHSVARKVMDMVTRVPWG